MKKILFLLLLISTLVFASGCDNSDRDVSISLPSGQYYGEQHVTLSCVDPTAQITYTLDGSDPGESELIYDSETGIDINYTSDLKATAGGNVAEAHYDITPYDGTMDANQKAFYDKISGNWVTDESMADSFNINSTSVTFQTPGAAPIKSGYYIKDVNGNTANLVYTDPEGKNVTIPIQAVPENEQVVVNGKTYTRDWMF